MGFAFWRRKYLVLFIFGLIYAFACAGGGGYVLGEEVSQSTSSSWEVIIAWLLDQDPLIPEPAADVLGERLLLQSGVLDGGRRWLMARQSGKLPQHIQLLVLRLPAEDPEMSRRALEEMMLLIERRCGQDPVFSTVYLIYEASARERAAEVFSEPAVSELLCSRVDIAYAEQGLMLNSNSDVLLMAAAQTAAELSISCALDPWISLGLSSQDQLPDESAGLLLQGGGRRVFELAGRLLWRIDGQELPVGETGLSFTLWGQILQVNAAQRAWLIWLGLLGCAVSLLRIYSEQHGIRFALSILAPLLTISAFFLLRIQGQFALADFCLLWLAVATLLLFLPSKLRRLMSFVQLILLLPLLQPLLSGAHSMSLQMLIWLALQLLWSLVFY